MILFRAAVDFRRVGMARSDNFFPLGKEKGRKMKDFQSFFYVIFFLLLFKALFEGIDAPTDTQRAHHERVPVRCHRHLFLSEKGKVVLKIFLIREIQRGGF